MDRFSIRGQRGVGAARRTVLGVGWLVPGLMTVAPAGAQDAGAVYGVVVEQRSRAPIARARILTLTPAGDLQLVTVSGPRGEFVVPASVDSVRLVAARIGFAPETLDVVPGRNGIAFQLARAPLALGALVIEGAPPEPTASSTTLRQRDFPVRPRHSSADLLRLVPGLVVAQHAGGGKAEQLFLRGFNADHGTDVALTVDGTPINLVSHAHGQGYADLHFLIPEVVEALEVRKGPYGAEQGDFATAGTVTFTTRDRLDGNRLALRAGSFGAKRALAMVPLGGGNTRLGGYVAGLAQAWRGPFEHPQDHRRLNLFTKWTSPVANGALLEGSASAYRARWDASGQIPERAVLAGSVSRYGAIDPTEGGDTDRLAVSLGLETEDGGSRQWSFRLYGVRYRLALFSNFTYFLSDSVDGDGIEQRDDRSYGGLEITQLRRARIADLEGLLAVGIGARFDAAAVALYRQRARQRLAVRADDAIHQTQVFGWLRYDLQLTSRVKAQAAVRTDLFGFDVAGRGAPGTSRWQAILSPKVNVAASLARGLEAFAHVGTGFHSNDARVAVAAERTGPVVPRALGGELGARATVRYGSLAGAVWRLDLQDELVYLGDEGGSERKGPTRRVGLDLRAEIRLAAWLWGDLDLTLASGRLRDARPGENRIPLAPTVTTSGGLSLRDAGLVTVSTRFRYVGSRPADETGRITARAHTLVEAFAEAAMGRFELSLGVENLLNVEWNEAQFANTSRLRHEPAGVYDLHFTPGLPRSVEVGIQYRL